MGVAVIQPLAELLRHQEEQVGAVETLDLVLEAEVLEDVAGVLREAVDRSPTESKEIPMANKKWPPHEAVVLVEDADDRILRRNIRNGSDKGGVAHWSARLIFGEITVRDLVRHFFGSNEYRSRFIADGRPSDVAVKVMYRRALAELPPGDRVSALDNLAHKEGWDDVTKMSLERRGRPRSRRAATWTSGVPTSSHIGDAAL